VFSTLKLPPYFTVAVAFDPDKAPLSIAITVFHEGNWIGEASVAPPGVERPGSLQEVVDMLTKRGVHR
jgi:hypothetical protein